MSRESDMTPLDLLAECGIHAHTNENGGASFVCKCGGAAELFDAEDGRLFHYCPKCAPDTGTSYSADEFREHLGNGNVGSADLETLGTPGTWEDLRSLVGPVEWDWPLWVPRALLIMIVAALGVGKSLAALAVARTYLLGEDWPDGTPFDGALGCVLWVETEAGEAINLERAERWGLPLERLLTPYRDPLAAVTLTDSTDRAGITEIAQEADVSAVIVDSLSGGNTRDENSAAMLGVTTWLARLARDTGKPVYLTHHVRKARERDHDPRFGLTLDMVRGHTSICQPARVIWALDFPSGPGSDIRRLHQIKNNLRRFPDPLGMRIDEEGNVLWGDAPQEPADATASGRACAFLKSLLGKGPVPSATVLKRAEDARIAPATLNRAKRASRIVSLKVEGTWVWSLPVSVDEGRE